MALCIRDSFAFREWLFRSRMAEASWGVQQATEAFANGYSIREWPGHHGWFNRRLKHSRMGFAFANGGAFANGFCICEGGWALATAAAHCERIWVAPNLRKVGIPRLVAGQRWALAPPFGRPARATQIPTKSERMGEDDGRSLDHGFLRVWCDPNPLAECDPIRERKSTRECQNHTRWAAPHRACFLTSGMQDAFANASTHLG
jgi:hypothetical protein